jgi:DNA-binding CsgD family transcriptional regulator
MNAIILDLWNNGKDTYDIARELGVHESVIYNELSRLNGDQRQRYPYDRVKAAASAGLARAGA